MRCRLTLVTSSIYVGVYVIFLCLDIRTKLDCAIQVRDMCRTIFVLRLEDVVRFSRWVILNGIGLGLGADLHVLRLNICMRKYIYYLLIS